MKSKKLKKLIKESLNEFQNTPTAIKSSFNNYLFTDVSDDIKSKTRNLIYRLLNFRDNLNMSIDEDHIYISSETGFDFTKNTTNSLQSPSDYLSIDIIKQTGYLFHWRDKRFAFKDTNLYQDVISKIEITFKELNEQNFIEIYGTVLKESGLSRDSNLDELLSL